MVILVNIVVPVNLVMLRYLAILVILEESNDFCDSGGDCDSDDFCDSGESDDYVESGGPCESDDFR